MRKKLTLDADALTVASFTTDAEPTQPAGTVHARAGVQPTPPYYACTCNATCLCPSAYYYCGDGYYTLYSCDYTHNESCAISKACTAD